MKRKDVERLDAYTVRLSNSNGRHATLFATENVAVDNPSVDEAISVLDMVDYLQDVRVQLPDGEGLRCDKIIFTPDFHRGAGIPVGTVLDTHGFVLPKAIGSDIGCGMRLLVTNLTENDLTSDLTAHLRYRFFEGGRDVAISRRMRRDIFRWGLLGLVEHGEATEADQWAAHGGGAFPTEAIIRDALGSSASDDDTITHDGHLGSIGGGNHFVEIQVVDEIIDKEAAYAFGLRRGALAVMCHSGSLSIGHYVMRKHGDIAKQSWPTSLRFPPGDYFPLTGDRLVAYVEQQKTAVNFAFANRFYLGRTALRALADSTGKDLHGHLVQDAPHNAIWNEQDSYIHRKGACTAEGIDVDHPFGHPVIVPGSMGDYSYVLRGQGAQHSLCSACHGAGRITRRGDARRVDPEEIARLSVVTPWDPTTVMAKMRPDMIAAHNARLMEEVPSAYKPVGPAIATCIGAEIAAPVAKLRPLITVKG